ncbi:MAG: hypothetical protein Greene07147_300 [Parcubacteria group bacterium Greene0714_7]|nr:MAG: hypothetical protein Greene07147_300 [Parcubacteria group bacterium Greene0714_7]
METQYNLIIIGFGVAGLSASDTVNHFGAFKQDITATTTVYGDHKIHG